MTRVSLRLTLAAVFVVLFIAFGLALILFFHSESRRIAILGANDSMDRIGPHMQASIAELYRPAQVVVDIASRSASLAAGSLEERLGSLGILTEALRLNPHMSSIFIGRENGDSFLVRSIGDLRIATWVLDAPPGSRFAVQSIERDAGDVTRAALLFFDEDLRLIDSRPLETGEFDPRKRGWYRAAIGGDDPVTTDFYVFFTTREVGLTFARRLIGGGGVVGADLALADLSTGLARQRVTPSTKIAIFDPSSRVIALSTPGLRVPMDEDDASDRVTMPRLSELEDPVYTALARQLGDAGRDRRFQIEVAGERWLASVTALLTRRDDEVYLATMVPLRELLADIDHIRNQSVLIALALLALASAVVLWVSRGLSASLGALAHEAEQIRQFKLARPLEVRSRIAEVDELASTMAIMKGSLQKFFAISRGLAVEKDYRKLLEMILREARKLARADGGSILMTNSDETALEEAVVERETAGVYFAGTGNTKPDSHPIRLDRADEPDAATFRTAKTIRIDDIGTDRVYDPTSIRKRYGWKEDAGKSLLNVPLTSQKGEIIGVLQLVNARSTSGEVAGFDPEVVPFIEALSADAAVTLDLRRMLQAQKDLLDAIIKMVAGAIDAKSPYTYGHCQRVPVIARLLAEAAQEADDGPFSDFELSDDEWHELDVASWLHDCGKLTTPEYVVDKATRLETIYNRLHEIRTRFEVLWRDAEIAHLRALAVGQPENPESHARLERRLDQIQRDFRFIAECNCGETFMDEARIQRVREIGAQTWIRHLDDRIGISEDELGLKHRIPIKELPVEELLLADRPEHLVPRDGAPFADNPHGFRMEVPEHLYNRGEIYNLCIRRGTLTAEERFKINEHIIESINMLDRLPFPKELSRVPDWAGNHHERLDGKGYPRGLSADELSIPARIMALADIFEALTASDRPYKPSKKLSQALSIMSAMRDEGHICPDLFDLFLTSGAFLKYGEAYLQPQQVDEVDITNYVRLRFNRLP